jgi:hypothetical protein
MAREKARTKSTGGGGFTFADKIAAGFLARMLRRQLFLGGDVGPVTEIDFETSESGNPLDDLQLTLGHGQQITRIFLSVKSNRQLTTAGFDAEFVADAWEQSTAVPKRKPFDPEVDLLGLTAGMVEEDALHAWTTLQREAVDTTPQRLLDRLVPERQTNQVERDIFDSLRATGTEVKRDALEAARLVSRIRLFPFSEEDEGDYVELCTEIVADGSLSDANNLWGRLLQVAADSRGTGAHYGVTRLLRRIRPDIELKDYPDFAADWVKLEALSAENLQHGIQRSLGNGFHLARDTARAKVAAAMDGNEVTVVSGESGSGKSSLISELVRTGGRFRRVVCLTTGQLAKPSQIEVALALNLRHPVPELLGGSAVRGCALVIDGFEQFEGDARRNIIRILKELNEQKFENWRVVLSCQPLTLGVVRDALFEAGVASFERVDFEKPELEEIMGALTDMPSIYPLLLRKELQPILRNLMILDWVIRAGIALRIPASQAWVGETEIIDLIWDRWVDSDVKSFARDALLRLLGRIEGEQLTGAVHIDAIPIDQLPLLGELAQKGLVRTDDGAVRFFHDLMGDWARYRSLKLAGGGAAAQIQALAKEPRWGRAIRLYAQSLAESPGGLTTWKKLEMEVAGDAPEAKLAGDFLLDALLFAPNSEALLEQVWDDLIGRKGEDMKRLLQRLLSVASVPDWRFEGLGDARLGEEMQAQFRIPHPLYWYPVLRVLARHSDDIVELAPALGAKVSALWLRTMPDGTVGRNKASQLAVELAKELQGHIAAGKNLDKKSQIVFEALFYAAPDRLDEVAQMALELSGRRDEPSYAIEWAAADYERREKWLREWREKHPEGESEPRRMVPGSTSYRLTRDIPPEKEGPQRRVPDSFRSAVLDTPALGALIASRPEAAGEVLLAMLIQEPREVSRSSEDRIFRREKLGLSDWHHGNPPMPWKGAFLRFLETSPNRGLDTIVRLVNYATAKWLQNQSGPPPTEEQRRARCLELEVNGRRIFWAGDINVLGWNRLTSVGAVQVECALMALEQWFDNEVEHGQTIDPWDQYLFEHGLSIAFAGVLISVGQRFPVLFATLLQPLLGNFYLYEWQRELADTEQDKAWAYSLATQPKEIVDSAVQWHDRKYRRCLLRDIAVWLMHQDDATCTYLMTRKAAWKEIEAEGEGKTSQELFLARFDPQNYTETPGSDGCVELSLEWPFHLQTIINQQGNDLRMKELALGMAALSGVCSMEAGF